MPIYEYSCNKCGETYEEMRLIEDRNGTIPCTKCDGTATKVTMCSAFILKGGGWAADGYVSKIDKFKANMAEVDNY